MEPVVALFWLMLGTISVTAIIFKYLRERSRNALLRSFVEKGLPLPSGIFQETAPPWDPRSFFIAGILLAGLAVAIGLFGLTILTGWLHGVHTEKDNLILILSVFPLCLSAACMVAGRYLRSNG